MIIELNEIPKLKPNWQGKKVGLITGCFDILHLGHISIFEFAKSKVDILLVGVDSDKSIKLNKGENRPYFSQNVRKKVVDSIAFIDYTFLVDHGLKYSDPNIGQFFDELYKQTGITNLITNKQGDASYKDKVVRANKLGIEIILQDEEKFSSSTDIIEKLGL